MTSLERILSVVQANATDRVPVIPQVFGHAAAVCGVPLRDYVSNGETLARCQLEALKRYRYDAVFGVMDANVETEAVGSVLQYSANRYPVVERYALSRHDGEMPVLPDPQKAGRMPQLLKALSILRGELRDEVLVVGCVLGPFTLTAQLLGLEPALYLAADDPERLEQIMDFATEMAIRFGQAQFQAGAHVPMVFDPAASCAVVPAAFFREFELPRLRRVFTALAAAGAKANWLHIAGPVSPILPYYPEAGVQIANFDYYVSAEEAKNRLPGVCLDGNLKSLLFVEGRPAEIEAQASGLVRSFQDRGSFILSSGCEIPPESFPENVAALVAAARA